MAFKSFYLGRKGSVQSKKPYFDSFEEGVASEPPSSSLDLLSVAPWFSQNLGEIVTSEGDRIYGRPFLGLVAIPSPFERTKALPSSVYSYSSGALSHYDACDTLLSAPLEVRGTAKDITEHWIEFITSPKIRCNILTQEYIACEPWRGFFSSCEIEVAKDDLRECLQHYASSPLYPNIKKLLDLTLDLFLERTKCRMIVEEGFRNDLKASTNLLFLDVRLCLVTRDPYY